MSRTKLKVAALVLLSIISVIVLVASTSMDMEDGIFPVISGIVTIVSCILVAYTHFKESAEEREQTYELDMFKKPIGLILATICYIILMPHIGYVVATIILSAFCIIFSGYKKYAKALALAVLFVLITFVVFKYLLLVPLPTLFLP